MAKGACWLFLGPEIGEKEEAVNNIRKNLGMPQKASLGGLQSIAPEAGGGGGGRGEETVYYAGETPAQAIAAAVRNGSLFAEARLFIVKNIEVIKKKDETELLASCLSAPQDDTAVVLLSDGLERDVSKVILQAVPAGNRRTFWELDESRKAEWVEGLFRRQGFRVTPEGVAMILELVENNTGALRRECERLMLFLSSSQAPKTIDGEAAEKWLSHTREESAFTLFSRIARGDLPKSIESVRTLLAAKQTPPAILAGLAWCYRKLRDYLALRDAGTANDFELRKIGLGSRTIRQDYIEAGRRLSSADPCLALIASYDIRLRAAGSQWELPLMDNLICALAAAR